MADVTLHYRRSGSPELLMLRVALASKGISPKLNCDAKLSERSPVILEEPFRRIKCPDALAALEYIDERFPSPPLMPIDPVSRMRIRSVINRISQGFSVQLGDNQVLVEEIVTGISAISAASPGVWLFGNELCAADCAAFAFLHTKVPRGLLNKYPVAFSYLLKFEQHEESARRVGIGFFD